MSDEITLGGQNTPQNQPNQNLNKVPDEFIDKEFAVPTDDVELPSGGIFYPTRQRTVSVRFMTAVDENTLLNADLITSGKVLDVLLEKTIQDKFLRPENMLTGDRNAILLWLRSNGYGDDYPVKKTCPSCSQEFEAIVLLSELEKKETTQHPDQNGEFEFFLPRMKMAGKLRLLTGKDEANILKKEESMKKLKGKAFTPQQLTERYLLQIMELNGQRDKLYIQKAIESMPIYDSQVLREFIKTSEPGIKMETNFECSNCGHEFESDVPVTAKLFWPDAKI